MKLVKILTGRVQIRTNLAEFKDIRINDLMKVSDGRVSLVEVSLIDEKKVPCYTGTSIETRASGEAVVTTDLLETRAEYVEMEGHKEKVDYEAYRNRIRNLEKEM